MKSVYLDTNAFFFAFFQRKEFSNNIAKIFSKVQKGELKAVTSALTLDELAYAILMRLVEKKFKRHPIKVLHKDKSAVKEFVPHIQKVFDTIFSMNIEIVSTNKAHASSIPLLMDDYFLLPRDAIHYQTALDNGCEYILTTDPDFDNLPKIKRLNPEKL